MKLYALYVEVIHPYAYQPDGCRTATATDILWDEENRRTVVELIYDNGAIDWIPLHELNDGINYRITNR